MWLTSDEQMKDEMAGTTAIVVILKNQKIYCVSQSTSVIFGILSETKWLKCTNGKYQLYMLIFNVYFLFL